MATRIMCRRFSGRPCRAAVLPTMTKAGDQKAEDVESPGITEKNCKPTVIVKVWKPPERGLSSNPSAYSETKSMSQRDISRVLENGSLYRSNTRARVKEIQNTYSISCSRKLSSTRNTLPDIGILKGFPTYSSQIQPTQQGPTKEDGPASDAGTYDRKEDARAFQKERPDYKGLCYDRHELPGLTSTEEGRRILQEVTALKSSLKPGTIAEYMFKLSCLPGEQHGIIKSSPMFVTLCYRGVESIREFEISELIKILKAFVQLSIPYNHTMLNVYEAECCRRVWDMNLDQLLLVADLWHCLNYGAHRYVEIMMSCIGVHWKDLSLPQLVQLVYIIGGNRRAPEELMKKLDVLVLKYLDRFSLEEIGSICLGFFKSKHGISVETMKRIADKISTHIANVSSFTLVNVLKMLRFTHVDHPEFLKQLGNVAPSQLPSMNIQAVMHLTLACAALRYLDERLLNAVAASVPSRAAYCRSKDLAKLLWSFGSLNYEPHNAEEFFASLEKEIRAKMHEFQRYPQHLLTSLLALAFVKRFPVDLIDYVLGPEFKRLSKLCEFELHKDLFTLDGTVEIECPGYKGNRLAPEFRQEATNILWSFAQKELCVKPEVSEALALLEDILGGPQYVKNHMILPHTRSVDLEIHLDCDQKPLPFNSEAERKVELKGHEVSLTDNLMNQLLKRSIDSESKVDMGGQGTPAPQEQPPSAQHRLPFSGGVPLTDAILNALTQSKSSSEGAVPRPEERQKGGMKIAIQVSNRNHYCYGLKHLLGLHVLKRRQLSQIGYVVVELPFWEWFPLLRCSRSEKVSYLRHKVFNFSLPGQKKCM